MTGKSLDSRFIAVCLILFEATCRRRLVRLEGIYVQYVPSLAFGITYAANFGPRRMVYMMPYKLSTLGSLKPYVLSGSNCGTKHNLDFHNNGMQIFSLSN